METWSHPEKDKVRELVCRKGNVYKSVLLLPSHSMLDLKVLLKNKCIDKSTHITALERDKDIAAQISQQLQDMGFFSYEVVARDFDQVPFEEGVEWDFVYLDTCSMLTRSILAKLLEMAQRGVLKNQWHLGFCEYARGGKDMMQDYEVFLNKFNIKVPKKSPSKAYGKFSNPSVIRKSELFHSRMSLLLSGLFGKADRSYVYKNDNAKTIMHVFSYHNAQPSNLSHVAAFLQTFELSYQSSVRIPKISNEVKSATDKVKQSKEFQTVQQLRSLKEEGEAFFKTWTKKMNALEKELSRTQFA